MSRLSQFLFRRKPRPAFPVTRDDAIGTFASERAEEANEIAGLVVDLFNGAYVPLDVRYGIAHAVLNAGYAKEQPIQTDEQVAYSLARPAAEAAGLTVNETVGLVHLLADHGIIGADAGTSIRTIAERLADTPSLRAFTHSSIGRFSGLENFASELQRMTAPLSGVQIVSFLRRLFGSDATRAANVIAEKGAAITDWIPGGN